MNTKIIELEEKEYNKQREAHLKWLQKTYSWYKNIEDSMNYWEKTHKKILQEIS